MLRDIKSSSKLEQTDYMRLYLCCFISHQTPNRCHCHVMLLKDPYYGFLKWPFMYCVTKWMKTSCNVLNLKMHWI